MHVAVDMRSAHPGLTGIGRYAFCLALSLLAMRPSITLTLITSPAGAEYLKRHFPPIFHVVSSENPQWDQLELPDLLKRLRVDIYHTPLFVLPMIKACAYVCTIHDVIPLVRPDLCPASFLAFFRANIKRALRSANHVVTVSEHSRNDLLRTCEVDPSKVSVIHEPVSPMFQPRPGISDLADVGLKGGFILSVGALDRRKNLSRLLEAYSDLVRNDPAVPTLVLVGASSGDGFDLDSEIDWRGLKDRVRPLGRVSDEALSRLYAAAGLFVFPSLYEGFGLPVVEAMASGTPVITSNTSSLPEVAGDAAILVNPEDSREISDAMRRVLRAPLLQRELSEKGRARAGTFSLTRQGQELFRLYSRVMAGAA